MPGTQRPSPELPGHSPVGAAQPARRYRAFVSYSHHDARWAGWLHRRLEGYRVPTRLRRNIGEFGPLPERLSPIFRDREDLASAGELGPRIQAALADSDAMIVVCSPEAAHSPWVNEEILAFKRLGRGDRIYALIVAGEPHAGGERECFPPALGFALGADGQPGDQRREPLAADVRPGKDGKYLAGLKILSGLLGLPLDTLRQRDAARRQRRQFAVTALAMVVMLVTSFLAVQAVMARHAAERRQKQAETLVDFMLGDLHDKLSEVSRQDILEAVGDQAMIYFQSLPTTDVTDESLELRAKALEKIGTVRLDQGKLPQALKSYQAALVLAEPLANAAPANLERQLAFAHVLAFIGLAHWYQGDLAHAQEDFASAQAVLLRAQAHAPHDRQLLSQLANLHNNFGHVLEARGDLDAAMAQYRRMLAMSQRLVKDDPANTDWQVQLGLAHNNLAKMALMHGELATAIAEYRADVAIEIRLAQGDTKNNSQAEKVLLARAALGRSLALGGDLAGGIDHMRNALDEALRLQRMDPGTAYFSEDVGLYTTQLARLLRQRGDLDQARALSRQGRDAFARLRQQDPANFTWQRGYAEALVGMGEQALADRQVQAAHEHAQSALAVLEPQLAQQPNERATVLATLAARLLLASTTPDTAAAARLREQVLATANAQASGRNDPRLRLCEVEALQELGRHADARLLARALLDAGVNHPRLGAGANHRDRQHGSTAMNAARKDPDALAPIGVPQ